MIEEGPLPPPVTLGPYTIEYLGKRLARRVLRIRAGRHTLDVFATLDGIAAKVTAELDGTKLMCVRRPREYRQWWRDPKVQRWVLYAAAEFDGVIPTWSYEQIARNLKRSALHAEMSAPAVNRLVWRHLPELAKRRAHFWRVVLPRMQRGRSIKILKKTNAALVAKKEACNAELEKAGLLERKPPRQERTYWVSATSLPRPKNRRK